MSKGLTWDFGAMLGKASARDIFMHKIIEIAENNKDVMYIAADGSPVGSMQDKFRSKFPDQFLDVGIAEANAIGVASGLALNGKRPYVNTFGPFLSLRATDQINVDLAYNDVPVCVIGTHGGLTSGGGPTHYTLSDFGIMRAIPNMTLVAPADANQCGKLIDATLEYDKPIFVRVARGEEPLVYENQDYEFEIGKAIIAKEGGDATLIGVGIGVYNAMAAAKELEKQGINVRVLDMHTLKPIDQQAIITAAEQTGIILTVEDHNIIGGLGDGVAAVLAENNLDCKFKKLGIPDVFAALGSPEELYEYYGYDAAGIVKTLKEMMQTI